MKTIRNKTHSPVRVPLPRGKVLHLGPSQEGQISHKDVDHGPLQALIENEVVEIVEDQTDEASSRGQDKGAHADTHGHHPPTGSPARGDR